MENKPSSSCCFYRTTRPHRSGRSAVSPGSLPTEPSCPLDTLLGGGLYGGCSAKASRLLLTGRSGWVEGIAGGGVLKASSYCLIWPPSPSLTKRFRPLRRRRGVRGRCSVTGISPGLFARPFDPLLPQPAASCALKREEQPLKRNTKLFKNRPGSHSTDGWRGRSVPP